MAASDSEEEPSIVEEAEEREEEKHPRRSQPDDNLSPSPPTSTASPSLSRPTSSATACSFWACLTLLVSLITLMVASLYSLRPTDDKSWFLGLPHDLRSHYSRGRLIKAQVGPGGPPVEVFVVEHGPRGGETILLIHGLGCSSFSFREVLRSLGSRGLRAVAVDLPGAGFSDKLVSSGRGERWGGALGRAWDLYNEIKHKGLFWGFDQLIETGQIPSEDNRVRVSSRNGLKSSVYGSPGMSRIVGQVVSSLGLAPVHLVLHDSALGVGAHCVSANPGSVSSVTLVDSSAESAAFPSWIIGFPILSELVLRSHFVFAGLLRLCCSRSMDGAAAEAYLHLLNGRNGRRAVVEAGRALNFSFTVADWAASEAMKDVPIQVLWSHSWSDRWIDEGRQVAHAVPQAKFVNHFGGRWPQVMDIKRLNNMMSDHGIYSRERLLIPISNPDLLSDSTCYIEMDAYAKREVAVLYLEGRPDGKASYLTNRTITERGKRKILDSVKRSMQVDDGTAEYYLSIANGDPRAAILEFSEDLRWEQRRAH